MTSEGSPLVKTAVADNNESDVAAAQSPVQRYVTVLNRHDVLLGRGRPVVRYEGNIRFRKLVQNHKAQYRATGRNVVKDSIARDLIRTVQSRKGRFLRKVESLVELEELGLPRGTQAWIVASERTILQKVKQAFRDEQRAENEAEVSLLGTVDSQAPRLYPNSVESNSNGAAEQIAMLMNQANNAASSSTAAFIPEDSASLFLQQSLTRLRENQAMESLANTRQQLLMSQATSDSSALSRQMAAINTTSADLAHFQASILNGGSFIDATMHHLGMQDSSQRAVLPTGSYDNLLRTSVLSGLPNERMQQGQWFDRFADLQRNSTGAGSFPGPSVQQSLSSQLVGRQASHSNLSSIASLDQQLLMAQGNTVPFFPTAGSATESTNQIAQQITSAPAAFRDLATPLSFSAAQSLSERASAIQAVNFQARVQALSDLPSINQDSGHVSSAGYAQQSHDAALDAWRRSLQEKDSQMNPPGR